MEAKNLEMNPEIKKVWEEFLEWMYQAHQLMRYSWMPDYYSIKLWEEFKETKKK